MVLVDPDDPKEKEGAADDEALGAAGAAPELLLPNENPEVDALAVVDSVAGLLVLPNEKVGASFLLSPSLVVELEKLKPPELPVSVLLGFSFAGEASVVVAELAPKLNEGAGAELDPDVEEEAKLSNNCAPLLAAAVDGAEVDISESFLDSEEEAVALLADPNEKGFGAVLEAAGAGEGLGAAAGGAGALASLVAPNENPPEVDEVLAVEAAPNLKPPVDTVAVSLVVDVSFVEEDCDLSVAPNLKPVEEDVLVVVVAEEDFDAAPN